MPKWTVTSLIMSFLFRFLINTTNLTMSITKVFLAQPKIDKTQNFIKDQKKFKPYWHLNRNLADASRLSLYNTLNLDLLQKKMPNNSILF